MRRSVLLPLLGLALCAAPAAAQGSGRGPDGPGPMPGGPGPDPASMFLAATGPLHLTDAQVVRLAAIARRAEERRTALRANLAPPPAAGADRRPSDADMQRMRQQMEQMHEQMRADLRDALAVLTPDQQAMAFEMAAHHGGPGGHGPGGPGGDMMRRPDGPPPPRPDDR